MGADVGTVGGAPRFKEGPETFGEAVCGGEGVGAAEAERPGESGSLPEKLDVGRRLQLVDRRPVAVGCHAGCDLAAADRSERAPIRREPEMDREPAEEWDAALEDAPGLLGEGSSSLAEDGGEAGSEIARGVEEESWACPAVRGVGLRLRRDPRAKPVAERLLFPIEGRRS